MKDEILLGRIARGDAQALSDLYDRYARLVYSLAYHVLQDRHQAEDVTQDVFLSLWKKSESYDQTRGKFSTWLGQVARNRAIDVLRRRQVRPEGNSVAWDEALWGREDDGQFVENQVVSREQTEAVVRALNTLPDEQRTALALAYYYGLSQSEIASLLDEPLGTTKTRIRLGMQKLREILVRIDGSRAI